MPPSTTAKDDMSQDSPRVGHRALTPPLPDNPAPRWNNWLLPNFKRQKFFNQEQSRLAHLPPEVRRIIWGYCDLLGNQLHIARTKRRFKSETGRLIGIRCSQSLDNFACNNHDCWGKVPALPRRSGCVIRSQALATFKDRWYLGPLPGTRSTRVDFLPVLRTCRWLSVDLVFRQKGH
jgi:hypothetical protein